MSSACFTGSAIRNGFNAETAGIAEKEIKNE